MDHNSTDMQEFLDVLGIEEEPLGVFYTGEEPSSGYSPKPLTPVTRELEEQEKVDWEEVTNNFSCLMGKVWLARRKSTAAYFSRERFGCVGCAFYLGFMKPYLHMHPFYVADLEGFFSSQQEAEKFFQAIDPPEAPHPFLVIKPISRFTADEKPEVVVFFAKPETVSGLVGLAMFVANDVDVIKTPFGPGCASIVTWPRKYLLDGKQHAVLGNFDPTCRKFLKTDEVSFAVPLTLYQQMLANWQKTFLKKKDWGLVKKKIMKSRKT